MENFLKKLSVCAAFALTLSTPVQAQSCATDIYSSAYAQMTSPEHQDAMQDTVVRFLEKGTFNDLNASKFDSPMSYLLMSEYNQYRTNFKKGGAHRYTNYDQNDLMQLVDSAFHDSENVTCTVTEDYVDQLIELLDRESADVLMLLLTGYKKNEIEYRLGMYRGKAGRILREKIIPLAIDLAG